jgi:hypothetical protein
VEETLKKDLTGRPARAFSGCRPQALEEVAVAAGLPLRMRRERQGGGGGLETLIGASCSGGLRFSGEGRGSEVFAEKTAR